MKTVNQKPINQLTFSTLLFLLLSFTAFSQEICDNGIDDDNDGLVDLNDVDDCACTLADVPLDIIPNPSFEDNGCCPAIFTTPFDDLCLEGWQNGTSGTADYLNTCDFITEGMPLPLPDGDGAIGVGAGLVDIGFGIQELNLEYMSTCLTEPLEAGEEYTLEMSIAASSIGESGFSQDITFGDAPITVYGLLDCNAQEPTTGCPEDFGWINLGSTIYSPINEWGLISIDLDVPQEIQGIALGVGCDIDDSYVIEFLSTFIPYFYLDDILIFQGDAPTAEPIDLGYSDCNETATLTAPTGAVSYQWYFEGVALVGETSDDLLVELDDELDYGQYGVVATNTDGSCTFQDIQVEGLENDLIIGSDVTTGCPPLTISFDANLASSGQPLLWTVGDEEIEGLFFELTFDEPGTYPVSASFSDENGCEFSADADPIVVIGNEGLTPTFDIQNSCSPFIIELGVEEAVTGCTWTLDDGDVIGNQCSFEYEYSGTGDFVVNVESSAAGSDCLLTGSITVDVSGIQGGNYTISGDFDFCEGDSAVISGSPAINTYDWGSTTGESFVVTEPGDYSVTITEPDGCEYIENFSVTNTPLPDFNPPFVIEGCLGEDIDFRPFVTVGEISFDEPSGSVGANFQGLVTVTATNECGSVDRQVELDLEDCSCKVYVPNAFTPDGDGLNDLFRPEIDCDLSEYELVIFNRWGNEVFRSESLANAWNGSSAEEEFFSPTSIYTYFIRYDSELNPLQEPIEIVGSVSVIR